MELSTVELELTAKTGAEKEALHGLKLMTLCTSGNVANLTEVFPQAEVIDSAVALEGLRYRTSAARPDAVIFLAEGISELFMQQIRFADKILKELYIPLIVVCDNLDKDTKKIVLKNAPTTVSAPPFTPKVLRTGSTSSRGSRSSRKRNPPWSPNHIAIRSLRPNVPSTSPQHP